MNDSPSRQTAEQSLKRTQSMLSESSSGDNQVPSGSEEPLPKKQRSSAKNIQAMVERQRSTDVETPGASKAPPTFENLPGEIHTRIANEFSPDENLAVARTNRYLKQTYLPHVKWARIIDYVTPEDNYSYPEIFSAPLTYGLADSQTIEERLRQLLEVAPDIKGCILDMPANDRAKVIYEIVGNCPEEDIAYELSMPHVLKLPTKVRERFFNSLLDINFLGHVRGHDPRKARFCLDILRATGAEGHGVTLRALANAFSSVFRGSMNEFRSILNLSARDGANESAGYLVRMALAQFSRFAENHYDAVDALANNPKYDSHVRHAKILRVLYRSGKELLDWWQPERRITLEQWTPIEARIATAAKILDQKLQTYVFEEDDHA